MEKGLFQTWKYGIEQGTGLPYIIYTNGHIRTEEKLHGNIFGTGKLSHAETEQVFVYCCGKILKF